MIVATWNVNSLRSRLEHVLRFLREAEPDVLCLQETKCTDDKFPAAELAEAGWAHQAFHGQKTYNGVAILSRLPLEQVTSGFTSGEPDPQARLIAATVGGVRIFNCYVPMGTSPDSEKFQYKLQWLARLRGEINAFAPADDVLVCGDMNVAPGDLDVWDPFSCEGRILAHPMERRVLQKVKDWGLVDAYRELTPDGQDFSWWDYRAGAFPRNHGFRIDHVLLSPPVMARCREVITWRDTRTWDKPSDHCPVAVQIG